MRGRLAMGWFAALGVVLGTEGFGFALWRVAKTSPSIFPLPEKYFRVSGDVLIFAGLAFALAYVVYRAHLYIAGMRQRSRHLKVENDKLKESLRHWNMKGVAAHVARARALWGTTTEVDPLECTYEDDPVFLQLAVDASLRKVLSQPIVQRLNHIRQLSFAYLKFGSATHTRLAHSLGACRNAELVMRRVFQEGRIYTQNGIKRIDLSDDQQKALIKLARFAALLHDLGHGPLSHALETHLGIAMQAKKPSKPDKELSIKYIGRYLSQIISDEGVNLDDLIGLMSEDRLSLKPWMHFIADLIDSPLDVDRMDYLVRDAHMTGLSIGGLNIQALIERAVPFEEVEKEGKKIELAFDFSALPYIEQFLYARDVMYLNCYEYPDKVCAERMLGRAFEDLMSGCAEGAGIAAEDLAFMTDQGFMGLVLECGGASTTGFRMAEMLMRGITFELVNEVPIEISLEDPNKPNPTDFDKLPSRIKVWAMAAMGEEFKSAYLDYPEDWARDLANRSGGRAEQSQILVTVPSLSIINKWAKEGEIRLVKEVGDGKYAVAYVKDLPNTIWKGFVATLARARLKIRIFVDPELSDQRTSFRNLSEKFFRE